MSAPTLIGSRYQIHVSRDGAAQRKTVGAYRDAYATDDEETVAVADDLLGYVHSMETGSTVDGPGIRLTLFVSGCLLRCQYCHNPDTWHRRNGRPVALGKMKKELSKYAKVLRISGGGLTISGGEPVQQTEFTTGLFRHAKSIGMHTCLDTSGRLGHKLTDENMMDIDLNLLDIKSGDPETYERVTTQPLQPTLDYARRLSDLRRPVWVRFVLVPGLTDAFDNVERVADIAASIVSVERVEVLRFHQMGMGKWDRLGIDYTLRDTLPPSPELTERVREQFRSRGLTVF